jgi:hypothetical protein
MRDLTNAGKRIRLNHTADQFTNLRPGDLGTIRSERFDGFSNTVLVDWDNGSSLSLIDGEDSYTIL